MLCVSLSLFDVLLFSFPVSLDGPFYELCDLLLSDLFTFLSCIYLSLVVAVEPPHFPKPYNFHLSHGIWLDVSLQPSPSQKHSDFFLLMLLCLLNEQTGPCHQWQYSFSGI